MARPVDQLEHRIQALAAVASVVPNPDRADILSECLANVQQIGHATIRDRALSVVVLLLPEAEIVDRLFEITDPLLRKYTLASAAPLLPPGNALNLVRPIRDSRLRDLALSSIVSRLPVRDGLAAAETIEDPQSRASALITIARMMDEGEDTSIQTKLLAIVRDEIKPGERVKLPLEIARDLSQDRKKSLIEEALAASETVGDIRYRDAALKALANQLPPKQGITTSLKITEPALRAQALIDVLRNLPEEERTTALELACSAVESIEDRKLRDDALTRLVPMLPKSKIPDWSSKISDRRKRLAALSAISLLLPAPQALEIANSIDESELQIDAIVGAIQRMAFDEAQRAIRSMQSSEAKAVALASLASRCHGHNQPELFQTALDTARSIIDVRCRARALAGMASLLAPEQRKGLIDEAAVYARSLRPYSEQEVEQLWNGICLIGDGIGSARRHVTDVIQVARSGRLDGETRVLGAQLLNGISELERTVDILTRAVVQTVGTKSGPAKDTDGEADYAYCRVASTLLFVASRDATEGQVDLMVEAVAAARKIDNARVKTEMLTAIARGFRGEQKSQILIEALGTAADIPDRTQASKAIGNLLSELPKELWPPGITDELEQYWTDCMDRAVTRTRPEFVCDLFASAGDFLA